MYFAHPDTIIWTGTTFEDPEYIFRTQAGIEKPTFTFISFRLSLRDGTGSLSQAVAKFGEKAD